MLGGFLFFNIGDKCKSYGTHRVSSGRDIVNSCFLADGNKVKNGRLMVVSPICRVQFLD
jgi:hypothetical protein